VRQAAIYHQSEIDELLSIEKWVDREAWDSRSQRKKWHTASLTVLPEIPRDDKISLKIELEWQRDTDQYHMKFIGSIYPRSAQMFARYDWQRGAHTNPPGIEPKVILPNQPHCHIYGENWIREGLKWDSVAIPIDLETDGSPKQRWDRLLRKFMDDLRISVRDAETNSSLFAREF